MDNEETQTTPEEVQSAPVTAPVEAPQNGPADSGFEDGHVLPDGTVIRHDKDENGNYAGWHKEAPASQEVQI
jgi:hypothetical protein